MIKPTNIYSRLKNLNTFTKLVLSSVLLALSWWHYIGVFFIFIGFVPLFNVIDERFEKKKSKSTTFGFIYSSVLLWNLLTTYWVAYSSIEGALMAFSLNTLFMSCVLFSSFAIGYKLKNKNLIFPLLIVLWISFEKLHLCWDLSWTWLNLGNAFASNTYLVQWYELTGVFGGTIWVLISNVLIYKFLKNPSVILKKMIIAILGFPIILSFFIYLYRNQYNKPIKTINVTVIQPNINPWTKFESMHMDVTFNLAKIKSNDSTDLIIAPETDITYDIDEGHVEEEYPVKEVKLFLKQYKNISYLTGAIGHRFTELQEAKNNPRTYYLDNGKTVESYNSVYLIQKEQATQIYHKSKLVPGAEFTPFNLTQIEAVQKLSTHFGGTQGGATTQENQTPLQTNKVKISALICYESIFGDFTRQFTKNGGEFIVVITNDAWWDGKQFGFYDPFAPGYKQHANFSKLRAIENRQYVVRSANTGISCVINHLGTFEKTTKYLETTSFNSQIPILHNKTLYVLVGDLFALFLGLIISILIYFKLDF